MCELLYAVPVGWFWGDCDSTVRLSVVGGILTAENCCALILRIFFSSLNPTTLNLYLPPSRLPFCWLTSCCLGFSLAGWLLFGVFVGWLDVVDWLAAIWRFYWLRFGLFVGFYWWMFMVLVLWYLQGYHLCHDLVMIVAKRLGCLAFKEVYWMCCC